MMICFTGHEKENDLAEGIYTTEYRLYDARVGRWLSVDPIFEKYVGMSPYNYCNLNPLRFVDPTGMAGWELNPETGDFIWIPDLTEDNVAWGFEYFHPYELDAVKKKSDIIKKSNDVSQEASSEKKSANNDIQNKSTQNYGIPFWGLNSREDGVPYDAKDYGCPRDTWGLGATGVGSFMEMGNSIENFFTKLIELFSSDNKEETQPPSTSATQKKNEDNKVEYRTFGIYKAIPAGYHTDGVLKGTPYYSSDGKKEKIGVAIYEFNKGELTKIGEYIEK